MQKYINVRKFINNKISKYILSLPTIIKWILSSFGIFNSIFIEDKNYMIRYTVAKRKYKLEKLVNDEYLSIRCIAYENEYAGDNILNESLYIKEDLIWQGLFLDIFITDSTDYIKKLVIRYCQQHSFKEECKKILLLYNI